MKIQPPCDERDIDRAEQSVGIPFPKELRALLKELNGDRYLLLSVDETMKQSELNRQIQAQYPKEEFAKDLDKFIFFATNGCGDYYCYCADNRKIVDETVIYRWDHEESCRKPVASSIAELIARYYRDEI